MSESTCGFKSRQPHHLASLEKMPLYARVVELADSLDSGSSVHYGRAGSSPASRTSSSQATYRLRRAFSFHCKAHRALILLLLAFAKSHARLACSVASALTTAHCRYQLFAVFPIREIMIFALSRVSIPSLFCSFRSFRSSFQKRKNRGLEPMGDSSVFSGDCFKKSRFHAGLRAYKTD